MSPLEEKLREAFRVETAEHLEYLRDALEDGRFPGGCDLDEVFRRAHSLKGAARAVGLRSIEGVAHGLESLFARARAGAVAPGEAVEAAVGRGLDAIEDLAAMPFAQALEADTVAVLGEIEGLVSARSGTGGPVGEGESAISAPSGAVSADGGAEAAGGDEGEGPTVEPAADGGAVGNLAEQVRVHAGGLDRLNDIAGEISVQGFHQELIGREMKELVACVEAVHREWQRAKVPLAGRAAGNVQAQAEAMDRSLAACNAQVQAVYGRQRQAAWHAHRLGGQLQQGVRRMRMVEAGSVYGGFRKMVRDLARDEGKEVDFRVVGMRQEADRAVLQALKDPLMHLLRNALKHGIEPPAERRRRGKEEKGLIVLGLLERGNRLEVRVEDDGRGVDHRRVAAQAVRQGLLAEDKAEGLAPEDAVQYMFRPGFSTAEGVGELAGRGMGLSVVEQAAVRLQGGFEVRQRPAGGTVMALEVPLSMATSRLIMVVSGGQSYGLPSHGIERLCTRERETVKSVGGRPAVDWGEGTVPLAGLAALLGGEAAAEGDDPLNLMVLKAGRKRLAVAVDAFAEAREGLVQRLPLPVERPELIAGGLVREDGSVALVLNPPELLAAYEENGPVRPAAAAATRREKPTVLVVDDSFTTRMLEKSILEAHGYRVRVAVDGVEALERLDKGGVDLVVSDVEMPRLDGLGLVARIRDDRRLAETPVILVSSLERPDQRERGMEAGADAYITKQKFDQEDLLRTIGSLL